MPLPVLIDTDTLHKYLKTHPNALIVDVCTAENYAQGHIPGAVNFPPAKLSSGLAPATGSLPTPEDLKTLLESIGLTPNKHVIVYDDAGSSWAGRFIWTLAVIGHKKYSLLDGGITAWRADNLPISQEVPTPNTSTLSAFKYNPALIADKDEILAQLGQHNVVIWDARAPEEYTGTKVVSAQGGHIPGAINFDWVKLYDSNNHNRLLPPEHIQTLLDAAGLTSDKHITTHCQTHRRSGLTWFVATQLLGYKHVKAYPGSWAEWGNTTDLPVEK